MVASVGDFNKFFFTFLLGQLQETVFAASFHSNSSAYLKTYLKTSHLHRHRNYPSGCLWYHFNQSFCLSAYGPQGVSFCWAIPSFSGVSEDKSNDNYKKCTQKVPQDSPIFLAHKGGRNTHLPKRRSYVSICAHLLACFYQSFLDFLLGRF